MFIPGGPKKNMQNSNFNYGKSLYPFAFKLYTGYAYHIELFWSKDELKRIRCSNVMRISVLHGEKQGQQGNAAEKTVYSNVFVHKFKSPKDMAVQFHTLTFQSNSDIL